jgi:uncharacterized repeat protein (TIGR01451 family)
VRLRRLAEAVLMLGACLLLDSGRLYGQREVIATAVPVTPQTPAVSAPPRPPPPRVPGSPAQTIQQVSYVEGSQPTPTPMLPPQALLNGMPAGQTPAPAMQIRETPAPSAPATAAAMLSVEVVGPDRLLLNQPLVHEIVLRNKGGQPIAEVHIEEPLPEGSRVRKIDPPPTGTRGNRLAWDLRHLEAGGERRLKIELDLAQPGELDLRPIVSFLSGNGLRTQVIRPPFSIEISADKTKATRGERIRFRIQLANHGDAPVRNIKIYDSLPDGLHHPSGPKIGVEQFGDLLPGETKSLNLETTAVVSGPFHNEVIAQADRGVEAKAAIDGIIIEPSLSLRLDGPTQTVTHREMDFSIEAANPSVLTAKNVRLVQALPPAFEVVSASSGASRDAGQHALVWSLPELAGGQRQRVTFRIKANAAGDWPMSAVVQSQNFPEAHVKNALHAEAAALLKLDVHVREERLAVGDETVFRLHVLNKGDAPCTGVRLSAVLPEALALVKAEGPSDGQVEKQQITFVPLTRLDAYGDAIYQLRVRGRQAGHGSLRVAAAAEKQTPAEREISIQVHESAAAAGQANSNTAEGLR